MTLITTRLFIDDSENQLELDLYSRVFHRFWSTYASCKGFADWKEAMGSVWPPELLSATGLKRLEPGVEELLKNDTLRRIEKLGLV